MFDNIRVYKNLTIIGTNYSIKKLICFYYTNMNKMNYKNYSYINTETD